MSAMEHDDKSPGLPPPDSSGKQKDEPSRPKGSKRAADRAKKSAGAKAAQQKKGRPKSSQVRPNRVRATRIERMMSKAELARRANLSVLTIDRVEKGLGCRMDTKRKILEALGLSLADRVRVFGEEE